MREVINMGISPGDHTKDSLGEAFNKINNNFIETYNPTPTAGVRASILGSSSAQIADSSAVNFAFRNSHAPVNWLRTLSQGRIELPASRNYGVSGSSFQINIDNGRLALAANDESSLVIVALGTNDINNTNYNTIIASIDAYVAALRHKAVLFLGIHTTTTGSGGWSDADRLRAIAVNRYLNDLAFRHQNILFADPTRYLLDSNGELLPGMLYDEVHFSTQGSYWAGRRMLEVLEPVLKPVEFLSYNARDTFDAAMNPEGNLLSNAMFNGSGGTTQAAVNITGVIPTSWGAFAPGGANIGTSAAAYSVVSKSTAGNSLQAVISGAPGAVSNYSHMIAQGIVAVEGGLYRGRLGVEIDANAANLTSVSCALSDSGTGNFIVADMAFVGGQAVPTINETITLFLETPVITKGAGNTNLSMYITFNVRGSATAVGDSAATVRVFNPEIRRMG